MSRKLNLGVNGDTLKVERTLKNTNTTVEALRAHAEWVRGYFRGACPSCDAETLDRAASEIERLQAALKAGTDAAQTLLSLPADECNVPFDPIKRAETDGRRKAARHILDALNQQFPSSNE